MQTNVVHICFHCSSLWLGSLISNQQGNQWKKKNQRPRQTGSITAELSDKCVRSQHRCPRSFLGAVCFLGSLSRKGCRASYWSDLIATEERCRWLTGADPNVLWVQSKFARSVGHKSFALQPNCFFRKNLAPVWQSLFILFNVRLSVCLSPFLLPHFLTWKNQNAFTRLYLKLNGASVVSQTLLLGSSSPLAAAATLALLLDLYEWAERRGWWSSLGRW